ncbi:MAG: PhoH family protein [Gemmatimonadetes bacterium]|nr:PhoH family protein [Gemmatimonadota bacterium]MCY3942170.1 PhoH family protein [Gemmatimonadota bacterium]
MTATKAPPTVDQLLDAEGADHFLLAGVGDANLREVESLFGVQVVLRGDAVRLSGEEELVAASAPVVEHMIGLARLGRSIGVADVGRFAAAGASGGRRAATFATPERDRALQIAVPGARRVIRARSEGQRAYLRALSESDIVIAIGPAGTGKTYLAVASAVDALLRKRVRRIILARPAVEAGENLGFLPGDLQEKVDPYLRPLYDALEDMMPPARVRRGIAERVIEIAPLAYMRGRTISDAFAILDEAQNATAAQMKMFLTRIGVSSRVVITGDKTQIDLPPSQVSGLVQVEEILSQVDGIDFVYLDESDVTRHRLVKRIVRAYAAADERQPELASDGGE